MRTTINVAPDVAAEMQRLREREGLGPSEALNVLARRGMARDKANAPRYRHSSAPLGLRLDVSNVAEVLEVLDADR